MRPIIEYQGPLFQWLTRVSLRVGYHNLVAAWQVGVVVWLLGLSVLVGSKRLPRLFTSFVLLGIGLLRIPGLGMGEQNVDESQWIVSAATLIHDPRFWLSVDGTTSGPLNVWPPALIYHLGLSLDYTTLRLWGLLTCILPTAWLLLATFRRQHGERVARLAMLPIAACLALATDIDAVAFNSEQLPMMLLALAGYMLSRIFGNKPATAAGSVGWLLGLGLLLGCLPYTKLQTTPIGLILAVWVLAGLYVDSAARRPRFVRMGWFAVGGLLPTVLLAVYLLVTRLTTYAFRSYVLTNLEYAKVGSWGVGMVGLPGRLGLRLPQIYGDMPTTAWFWCLAGILLGTSIGLALWTRGRSAPYRRTWWFLWSVCGVSLYATLQPGNPFTHYQWLSFVPAAWLVGSVVAYFAAGSADCLRLAGGQWSVPATRTWAGIYLAVSVVYPGWLAMSRPNPGLKELVGGHYAWAFPITQVIRNYARPNQTMVVWGWANSLHVETGLLLGSRFIPLYFQVIPGPQQAYFMDMYRQDLLRNRPTIIVDAVALHPNGSYDPYPIRRYPTIQAILDQRYRLMQTVCGAKIYLLKP